MGCRSNRAFGRAAVSSLAERRGALVSGYSKHRHTLGRAMMQLRVYEQRWIDLSYPAGDPRAVIPDDEQPQHAIDERDRLRREVVRLAALVGGETSDAASVLADTPLAADNPYNLTRVRVAASLVKLCNVFGR